MRSLEGGSRQTVELLAREVEEANVSLLPGSLFLRAKATDRQPPIEIQPDALLDSPGVYCLIEAKRLKHGSFQEEQLAREYVAVLQEAGDRKPLLLLVVPKPPPVLVSGHGRLSIKEAITGSLGRVLERAAGDFPTADVLSSRIESIVAYITWKDIQQSLERSLQTFEPSNPSIHASVSRLVRSALQAIRWHS